MLKSLDQAGLVAYIGTFSKTIFPELRIGYVVPPLSLLSSFAKAKAINDLADRHLQKELAAAAARKARLHIVAPVSGRLSLQIATGRFVRHGDPLFEVS